MRFQGAKPISRAAAAIFLSGAVFLTACREKKDSAPPEPELGGKIAAADIPADLRAGKLQLGTRLPEFELQTTDGEPFKLADMIDGEHYVAVIFHSPLCPCAENCAKAITKHLTGPEYDDLRIVGVVSDASMDKPWFSDDLRKQIENGTVNFPIVIDPDQAVLNLYGAERTPTVWLADKQGIIRFYGAPENTLEPSESRYHFLMKEALDALKAGRTPEIQRFDPIGCKIELQS